MQVEGAAGKKPIALKQPRPNTASRSGTKHCHATVHTVEVWRCQRLLGGVQPLQLACQLVNAFAVCFAGDKTSLQGGDGLQQLQGNKVGCDEADVVQQARSSGCGTSTRIGKRWRWRQRPVAPTSSFFSAILAVLLNKPKTAMGFTACLVGRAGRMAPPKATCDERRACIIESTANE